MTTLSPWCEQYRHLTEESEVRRLSRYTPLPIVGLRNAPVKLACRQLREAFDSLFVPTDQTTKILCELVGVVQSHAVACYPDRKSFLAGAYSKEKPLPKFAQVSCLTGLAGQGKSSLVKALKRVLPADSSVVVDSNHPPIDLVSGWYLDVLAKTTPTQMFKALLGLNEEDHFEDLHALGSPINEVQEATKSAIVGNVTDLLKRARARAYKTGVSILIVDELQWFTRSAQANASVTAALMYLASIGIPLVFVANFSLVHRLKKRPHEDQRRLLRNPIILQPDLPNSTDWLNTVQGYCDVAPDIFSFDPGEVAAKLFGWTEGIKSDLSHLLILAYQRAREKGACVGLAELEWAFNSSVYSDAREDQEIINRQRVTNKIAEKRRADLWCPFKLPASDVVMAQQQTKERRVNETFRAMQLSQIHPEERLTYESLQRVAMQSDSSTKAKVAKIGKRNGITADEFLQSEEIIRGE